MKHGCLRIFILSFLLILTGCVSGPVTKNFSFFDPNIEREVLYILPFDATLVPPDFGEPIFNQFVDILNSRRKQTKVGRFAILKEELKEVEPSWLMKQSYISGDVWGYVQNSGCCSTDMRVKSRIYLYEQGKNIPTFEISVPGHYYFDHDRNNIGVAKSRLGKKLAFDLAEAVLKIISP